MLSKENFKDVTLGHEIVHEFLVDESKRRFLKEQIMITMESSRGMFNRGKRKKCERFLEELDELEPYYITDNKFLYTYEENGKIKKIYDLELCYDLCKVPNNGEILTLTQLDFGVSDCWIGVKIDGTGIKSLYKSDDEDEAFLSEGDYGPYLITIWNLYEPDMYDILTEYIKTEEEIETLNSLKDLE